MELSKLTPTRLYALCDNTPCPWRRHEEIALELLQGGARIIQLRIKGRDSQTLKKRRQIAQALMNYKRRYQFCLIINDDPWLCRELGADGVHVGADDQDIEACRRLLGPNKVIGYSSHSLQEAQAAAQTSVDYIALGAIFPSQIKRHDHPVQGLETLKQVVQAVKKPIVAIGGIDQENLDSVLQTRVEYVAAISALTGQVSVQSAAQDFLRKLGSR